MKPKVLSFTLIALGAAISTCLAQGQTMSFLRQFPATPGIDQANAVAVDESGTYVMGKREFVPAVVLQVGDRSSSPAVWIAVAN